MVSDEDIGPLNLESVKCRFRGCRFSAELLKFQQYTYGVVSEGVFAESLRKFCGKFAEICRKYVLLRQERVRKFCGKLRKFRGKLRKIFCNDPFPNDPISELLKIGKIYSRWGASSEK